MLSAPCKDSNCAVQKTTALYIPSVHTRQSLPEGANFTLPRRPGGKNCTTSSSSFCTSKTNLLKSLNNSFRHNNYFHLGERYPFVIGCMQWCRLDPNFGEQKGFPEFVELTLQAPIRKSYVHYFCNIFGCFQRISIVLSCLK